MGSGSTLISLPR